MRRAVWMISVACSCWLHWQPALMANVPGLLNYQGRILVGPSVFTGTGQFKFALINEDGSQTFWRNSADVNLDGEPDEPVSIPVNTGLYSVMLGNTNLPNMAPLTADVFTNSNVYLRVWFNDGTIGFQLLLPDQRVAAVGYAMMAATVADGAITASKLAPDAWAALSNNLEAAIPSGSTVVSQHAQDAALTAKGYQPFMTVPAPAWATASTSNALNPRYGHTAVWTGQGMIIWGGDLGGGSLTGSGSSYHPGLDQWLTVSPVDAPSARSGHTALWTGEEMIIWGGYASGAHLNTGGRFRHANQHWTALPTTGAPSGREGHVSAWTGGRMVVWGGRNGAGLLGDGGFYELATGQWTSLNLTGAPTARSGATAVWAGDRLLVWGGQGTGGLLASGAQLFFETRFPAGRWVSFSLVNAPSARTRHTAVWTGRHMIVWGGQGQGGILDDGGVYDPVADVWTPIPSSGSASARAGHCALWTGQEMIVLAGEDGSGGVIASGAAYGPGLAQWRVLSWAGNPQARVDGRAVWTGTEVLVFGGRASGQPVGWLQRLNPQPTWHFYRKP
jgi:hypothetical protein